MPRTFRSAFTRQARGFPLSSGPGSPALFSIYAVEKDIAGGRTIADLNISSGSVLRCSSRGQSDNLSGCTGSAIRAWPTRGPRTDSRQHYACNGNALDEHVTDGGTTRVIPVCVRRFHLPTPSCRLTMVSPPETGEQCNILFVALCASTLWSVTLKRTRDVIHSKQMERSTHRFCSWIEKNSVRG